MAYLNLAPAARTSIALERQLASDDHANTWHAAPAAALGAALKRDLELGRVSSPSEQRCCRPSAFACPIFCYLASCPSRPACFCQELLDGCSHGWCAADLSDQSMLDHRSRELNTHLWLACPPDVAGPLPYVADADAASGAANDNRSTTASSPWVQRPSLLRCAASEHNGPTMARRSLKFIHWAGLSLSGLLTPEFMEQGPAWRWQ